jgi:hypothetical protein
MRLYFGNGLRLLPTRGIPVQPYYAKHYQPTRCDSDFQHGFHKYLPKLTSVILGSDATRWLTPSFTPYHTFMFLEILFEIRNQYKILRKKVEQNFYFLSKPQKNNFSDPQTTNPNKTRRKHF